MKRVRIECDDVTAWPILVQAAHRAALGKRGRGDVNAFFSNLEESLSLIRCSLLAARLPYGTYRRFSICDPKYRVIHAAPFADRVAHHALMEPLAQPLDNWQPATSYASRQGKGVHAAIAHAQCQCRRYQWYVKMDISGYFAHISHALLMRQLHRRLRGRWLFELIAQVLDSYQTQPGIGLPIGALTFQHFANVFLAPADRWLIAHEDTRARCRYMDDTVVWLDTRSAAKNLLSQYQGFLQRELSLKLKPSQIQQARYGLTFCGYRLHPERIRPGRRRLRRFKQLLTHWEESCQAGQIDMLELQRRVDSLVAMLAPGRSLTWRRQLLQTRLLKTRRSNRLVVE